MISSENKKLLANITYSGIFQGLNFLSPLITTPFLTRTIGIEKFGSISFFLAIISISNTVTDYGFSISATKDVVINIDNKRKLSELFVNVTLIRLLLALLVILIIYLLLQIGILKNLDTDIFLLGIGIIIGRALFPNWFFQGIQQMHKAALVNFSNQLLTIIFLLIFIRQKNDILLIPIIYSIASIIASLYSVFLLRNYVIKIFSPNINELKRLLKEGWFQFLTNIVIVGYSNANTILLGILSTSSILGYYSIAERLIFVVRQVIAALTTVVFPRVCSLIKQNHSVLITFYKQVYTKFMVIIFFICILIFIFANQIITILTSHVEVISVNVLLILSFIPAIAISNNPPYLTLLGYGHSKVCFKIFFYLAIFAVGIGYIFVKHYGAIGAAYSSLITELLMTLALYIVLELKFKKISLFLHNNKK